MRERERGLLSMRDEPLTIALAATFTAEAIAASINFWMQELGILSRLEFAPFNQVLQQLLDPSSLLGRNRTGVNVLLVRSADWLRYAPQGHSGGGWTADAAADLERNVTQFLAATRQFVETSAVPLLVVFCPNPDTGIVGGERSSALADHERRVGDQLNGESSLHIITSAELMSLYPAADHHNAFGEEEGGVPYTPQGFASIGTTIARAIFQLQNASYKVIVFDCDQTLWKGVCAEDGPANVEIDGPRSYLQEFMKCQRESGMLLCLCSKNTPDDVMRVFESRSDMPLRWKHITASRINWNPKSDNIRSLAKELKLDLGSFVFVDDSPVDCAEVMVNCPEVLTLALPSDPERIPQFLRHVWAFDRLRVTGEDRQRALFYQQDQDRSSAERNLGLHEFFAKLDLKVRISEARGDQLPRVAQLVERTNQFNMTSLRRSELQLRELWRSRSYDFLVVEAEDRYGDYGLVGAIIATRHSNALAVDTFLLSCRALGRGVEHQMLARLGQLARERLLDFVLVPYIESSRNQPALDFLRSVDVQPSEKCGQTLWFRFRAYHAAAVMHPAVRDEIRPENGPFSGSIKDGKKRSAPAHRSTKHTALLGRIAEQLNDPAQILGAITKWNLKVRPAIGPRFVPPERPIEQELAQVWADALGVDAVGAEDDFFALGGHSLVAVQIAYQVRQRFHVDFPLRTLFEVPILRVQAQRLEEELFEQADAAELESLLRDAEELDDPSRSPA